MSDEPGRVYEPLEPIARAEAEATLTAGDPQAIKWTLLCLAAYEPDWRWVVATCLDLAGHPSADVRFGVAMGLGHLARIQDILDFDNALPTLRTLTADVSPDVAVAAQDSLDDIRWLQRLAEREWIKATGMSNIITSNHDLSIPDLVINNGLTSVFLSALLLSGSELARTDWEIGAMVWLAEHDQSIVGSGVVGFDIWDLAWTEAGFAEQQTFMLATIDGALARHGWGRLDYEPRADWVLSALASFRQGIASYPIEYAHTSAWESAWSETGLRADRARCLTHGVYLHDLVEDDARCCIVCNDR